MNSACARTSRRLFEDLQRQGGIALFRDQLACGIGREFVGEEEIGGCQHVIQEADALADERRDLRHFLRLDGITGIENERQQPFRKFFDGQRADVFGVQPDGFGIEGVRFGEVHERVAAVHAFEGESLDEFVESHLLAVIAGRPAEQAEEIDEAFGEEARVAVGGHRDDRAVLALGELAAIGRDEQREMRELRGCVAGGFEDQEVLEGVGEVLLTAHDVADAEVDVVGAGGEMVGGHAVAAEEREVFDVGGRFGLLAVDEVFDGDAVAGVARDAETDYEVFARGGAAVAFVAGNFALAGVEEPGAVRFVGVVRIRGA